MSINVLTNLRQSVRVPETTTKLSNVHRGLAFEKRSMNLLERCLSMSLRHVGGKSDGGVDLQGWWWVPTSNASGAATTTTSLSMDMPRRRIRVFAQCKAEKKKLGPHYVRELEGVLHRHRHLAASNQVNAPGGIDMVGLLISQSAFTKAALLHATSSVVPFLLLHIPPLSEEHQDGTLSDPSDSEIGSIVFNHALSHNSGPLRGEVEVRWEWSSQYGDKGGRPGLWWKGRRIPSRVPDGEQEGLEVQDKTRCNIRNTQYGTLHDVKE
ncbi:hypothetical protein BXZ70DRAFT_307810 [Cristinia sonorae]|uniref:Restriction endonuclease type IV Mrr domain-containing protein n=1 Tax=Cristinia sonorae TaxID=1940300 RepID=A0A8K0ULM3_9AGAR|nr:hypothetical protein BXZ70DRAFT_307810 [Cristinia sonorae]